MADRIVGEPARKIFDSEDVVVAIHSAMNKPAAKQ